MGCVKVRCLKLTKPRCCVDWARMNHYETCLMVVYQKEEYKVLRMANISQNILLRKKKSKMATEIVRISDFFLACTGIQSPRFCK